MMFNDDSLVGRPRVDTPPPPPPPEGGHGAKRNLSSVDTDPRPPRPVRPHLTPEQSAEQARLRLTALVRTAMSPKVGGAKLKKHSVLREFELGEELGRGGFATVFLAYPRGGGDVRACKAIELTQVGNAIGQIEDEVRTLRRLDHPNICHLHDCYLTRDGFAMVLDLARGGELFDRICAKEHYSEREAKEAFAQLAEAVGHCHRHEVVHRDLKPENVLYADVEGMPNGEQIKLVDFGLATILAPDHKVHAIVGSPGYVAADVLRGKGYDHAADLWSLGVVLYVMLCGYQPFHDPMGRNKVISQMILRAQYEFHEQWWRGISGDAKTLVRRLLVLDPARRPSAEAVFEDTWMRGDATASHHIPSFSANWRRYKLKRKFKSAVLAVVAERRLASLCGVPETRTPVNIFLADSPASSSSALSSNPLPPEAVRQVTAQMSLCDPGDGEPMPED